MVLDTPKNILPALISQAVQIRAGGSKTALRKLRVVFDLAWAIPLVFLVRILNPLVRIRFGALRTDRIGHFALNTEIYLCERSAGMHPKRAIDLLYHTTVISNQQLKRMWDRNLRIFPLARAMDKANRLMPGGAIHQISVNGNDGRDVHGLLGNSERHLSFTPEEEISGTQALRTLGVPEGKPFVCMVSRDSNYLKAVSPDKDWGYHDYRNVDVQTLVLAAESLTSLGYTVFKMGSESSQWINTADPKVVDYARYHRTDFLDVYLSAKCDFFMTVGTGIDAVAEVFRRPIMWVNLVPFENFHSWSTNDLFITKKHWLPAKSRSMTFAEILDSGAGRCTLAEQYEDLGIQLIDNSPEEIDALAMEMHQRLSGAWQTSTEDEELQQRFKFLFSTSDRHGEIRSRMGATFLRQNQELLD